MQKLSDVINSTSKKNASAIESFKDILNECLVVESNKEDLNEHNVSIVGIEQAELKIKNSIKKELLVDKLNFCSQIYNNFRVGQYDYLDTLIESLESQLASLKAE